MNREEIEEYRPWTLAESMGKYIRPKDECCGFSFKQPSFDYENDKLMVIVAYYNYDLKWWLENGEYLHEDGTIGKCGVKI